MAQITISKEWLKEACQDVIDNALNEIKDEFIPKSVIEDIIAEIMQYMFLNGFGSEYQDDMRKIIEKHISGKKN